MAQSPPLPIALGRFKQLPQRSNETWQGGLVRLPAWIENKHDPAGAPYRPVGALWVGLRTGLVHMALPSEDLPAAPDLAVKALLEFGLKESKSLTGRPSVIEVRDPQLEQTLSETLSGLNTSVVLLEDLPAVVEVLRNLEAAAGDGHRFAGVLEGPGVTIDQLRAFADAAVAFFRAAPWRHLTNEDLIVVKATQVPKGMRHISVLGNGGQQFGLAFFESRPAFERLFSTTSSMPPRRAFGITFGPIDELPFADADAWEDARDWYQRGVDAGARALGPDRFAELTGEFWGHLETRPYMRARLALAQALHELGHHDDALDHYRAC